MRLETKIRFDIINLNPKTPAAQKNADQYICNWTNKNPQKVRNRMVPKWVTWKSVTFENRSLQILVTLKNESLWKLIDPFSQVAQFRSDAFLKWLILEVTYFQKWPIFKRLIFSVNNFQSHSFSKWPFFEVMHFRSESFWKWPFFISDRFRSDLVSKWRIFEVTYFFSE